MTNDETVDELFTRVRTLMTTVDLNNMPDVVEDALTIGAMSGRDNDDTTKRLLVLREQGALSRDEYHSIVLKLAQDLSLIHI